MTSTYDAALQLMHAVARKLVGRFVDIKFQVPLCDDFPNAATYRALDGTPTIHIDPSILFTDTDELFRVFTHELAHAKLHVPIMQPVNVTNKAARYSAPSPDTDLPTRNLEDEAEELANVWRKAARQKSIKYIFMDGETYFTSLLKALLHDYQP